MKTLLPQEIEMWYLIPALRREITKVMIKDNKLTQKKVAKILGLTEPAVSQYLKSKRGKEVKFTKSELKKIKETANKILEDESKKVELLYKLSISFRKTQKMCKLHKKKDNSVKNSCDICLKY